MTPSTIGRRSTGPDVSHTRRVTALEAENAKLKRLLAGPMRDNATLKGIAERNGDSPLLTAVVNLGESYGVSQREACERFWGGLGVSALSKPAAGSARLRELAAGCLC